MPKRSGKKKGVNELAKTILEQATGEKPEEATDGGKNPAAVALGRAGGLKGARPAPP